MTPERINRFREVASRRQPNLTVVLENVHDPHNIGAVLRSCDAAGVMEIYVLHNDTGIKPDRLLLGKKASGSAQKWVDVHFYADTDACLRHVKAKYGTIWATHLDAEARSMYAMDFTQSAALLFGNERDGLSPEALAYADANFVIPQLGMVRSLNISVACAVTLFEAMRQRLAAGAYDAASSLDAEGQEALFQEYLARSDRKNFNRNIPISE
jgi:tRNA (guanosine-2'-O-)-methyltransferase